MMRTPTMCLMCGYAGRGCPYGSIKDCEKFVLDFDKLPGLTDSRLEGIWYIDEDGGWTPFNDEDICPPTTPTELEVFDGEIFLIYGDDDGGTVDLYLPNDGVPFTVDENGDMSCIERSRSRYWFPALVRTMTDLKDDRVFDILRVPKGMRNGPILADVEGNMYLELKDFGHTLSLVLDEKGRPYVATLRNRDTDGETVVTSVVPYIGERYFEDKYKSEEVPSSG